MAGNSADYIVTPELVECVKEAGREILATGHNPVFVKEKAPNGKMTMLELCAATINEAKKIIASGHNARFGCGDKYLLREAAYAKKYRDRVKGDGVE